MTKTLVTRSCEINAPVAEVLSLVGDFTAWENWSPWQEADPQMRQDYFGHQGEVGSQMSWVGNKKAGSGRMTLVKIDETQVEIDLEFFKPWAAKNRIHFAVSPVVNGTLVTWCMTGHQNLLMKLVFRLLHLEKSIGADFERGLARLKNFVEHNQTNQ